MPKNRMKSGQHNDDHAPPFQSLEECVKFLTGHCDTFCQTLSVEVHHLVDSKIDAFSLSTMSRHSDGDVMSPLAARGMSRGASVSGDSNINTDTEVALLEREKVIQRRELQRTRDELRSWKEKYSNSIALNSQLEERLNIQAEKLHQFQHLRDSTQKLQKRVLALGSKATLLKKGYEEQIEVALHTVTGYEEYCRALLSQQETAERKHQEQLRAVSPSPINERKVWWGTDDEEESIVHSGVSDCHAAELQASLLGKRAAVVCGNQEEEGNLLQKLKEENHQLITTLKILANTAAQSHNMEVTSDAKDSKNVGVLAQLTLCCNVGTSTADSSCLVDPTTFDVYSNSDNFSCTEELKEMDDIVQQREMIPLQTDMDDFERKLEIVTRALRHASQRELPDATDDNSLLTSGLVCEMRTLHDDIITEATTGSNSPLRKS